MTDEPRSDGGVPLGLLRVEADDEPLRAHPLVPVAGPAGGDGDLSDPQVPGDGAVPPAGPGSAAAASVLCCVAGNPSGYETHTPRHPSGIVVVLGQWR